MEAVLCNQNANTTPEVSAEFLNYIQLARDEQIKIYVSR